MWDSELCGNSLKHPGQSLLVDIYHLVLFTSIERLGHRALTSGFSGKTVLLPLKRGTLAPVLTWKISKRMQPNVTSILTLKDDHTSLKCFEVARPCRWYRPSEANIPQEYLCYSIFCCCCSYKISDYLYYLETSCRSSRPGSWKSILMDSVLHVHNQLISNTWGHTSTQATVVEAGEGENAKV